MTVRQAIAEPQHMTQALFIHRTVINTNKVVQLSRVGHFYQPILHLIVSL